MVGKGTLGVDGRVLCTIEYDMYSYHSNDQLVRLRITSSLSIIH